MMRFDSYTIQARVAPGLAVMIPFFIEGNIIFTKLNINITLSVIIINLILTIALTIMANTVRYYGKKIEKSLFLKWNGAPTTRYLRYDNKEFNEYNKKRIKKNLAIMFSGIKMPTEDFEKKNPQVADKKYEAYIGELRAITRDNKKYHLLAAENRNYGFIRNMYGIKKFGIVSCISLIVINAMLFFLLPTIINLTAFIILNTIYLVILILWLTLVTNNTVKIIAESYAKSLLETCTIIVKDL